MLFSFEIFLSKYYYREQIFNFYNSMLSFTNWQKLNIETLKYLLLLLTSKKLFVNIRNYIEKNIFLTTIQHIN
jgi:hypothetical protein